MMSSIKAELRKIVTVRSTYLILCFVILLNVIFAFYVNGLKLDAKAAGDPLLLRNDVLDAINAVAFFGSLIGLLLISHEYRYNTISYTLTSAKRRSQVFFAKFVAISIFAILFSVGVAILSPSLSYLGLSLKGLHMAHQNIGVANILSRTIFMGWGMAIYAMIIASIIRVQVGAIATMFLATPVEGILSLVLKQNSVYLPFTAVSNVAQTMHQYETTSAKAAATSLIYIIVLGVIARQLYLRRDAN